MTIIVKIIKIILIVKIFQTKCYPIREGVLIPNLLNNPVAYCSLINLDFLILHTAHFDKTIVFPLLVFKTFRFILSVSFLHFKQYGSNFIYAFFHLKINFFGFIFLVKLNFLFYLLLLHLIQTDLTLYLYYNFLALFLVFFFISV